MSKIVFLKDLNTVHDGKFIKIGANQVRLIFDKTAPDDEILLSGFNLVNEHNGHIQTRCTDYICKYRTYEEDFKVIELSNDGSVWTKPLMKVSFNVYNGGTLDGETIQEVYKYEDVKVPTPVASENYKFDRWSPEVPTNGEVECDKTFVAMFEYVPTEEELRAKFETEKANKVALSKSLLADYLERHPLVSNCHGGVEATYTVTSEKQALMTSNYLKYTLSKQSMIKTPVLKWNATGEECEVWTEEEFVTLILQVAEYVEPLVSLQQSYEVQINACETYGELNAIEIVYDVYGASLIPEE